MHVAINQNEYDEIRGYLYKQCGVELGTSKQTLVMSRLNRRLQHLNFQSFADYFAFTQLAEHKQERQIMINQLTTNETYFFREPKHFDFLREYYLPKHQSGFLFRAWSAAASSGEEAYSIAMELAEGLGSKPWEVIGTDVNTQVLQKAVKAHYSEHRADGIPLNYLKKYCLKGKDEYKGSFLINKNIRKHTRFFQANLLEDISTLGKFDLIFLRNVLIYFDHQTKQNILRRLCRLLKAGGYLMIGHSESIIGSQYQLKSVAPSTYIKLK